jgi:uncharacterized lipoprotein YbaY
MNIPRLPLLLALVAAIFSGAGCGQISTTRGGDPERVITGTVFIPGEVGLPRDAVVLVRLIDTAATSAVKNSAAGNLPVGDRPKAEVVPLVLGEQTIQAGDMMRVPFRIEYRADDALLRHGLNLEARVSYAGRVRMRTVTFRAVTLGNANDPHAVSVESVAR